MPEESISGLQWEQMCIALRDLKCRDAQFWEPLH